jgi:hypothetical protein
MRWIEMQDGGRRSRIDAEWLDVGRVVAARLLGAPRTHALRCTTSIEPPSLANIRP